MICSANIAIHTFYRAMPALARWARHPGYCLHFSEAHITLSRICQRIPATNSQNGPRASSPGCKAEKRGDKLLHAPASVVRSLVRVSTLIPVAFSNLFSREIFLWTHTKKNVYQRVLHILEVARLNAQSALYCCATAGHHQGSP